jgi:hypothetical protein
MSTSIGVKTAIGERNWRIFFTQRRKDAKRRRKKRLKRNFSVPLLLFFFLSLRLCAFA